MRFGAFIEWIRRLHNFGRSLFQRGRTVMAMERFASFCDEMKEGWRSVRVEEEQQGEQSGCMVNNWQR